MSPKPKYVYEFGPFVLDTAQHRVLRHGNPVPLTPKTYDTLLLLVENRGRMLSKDELMKALWPDSFVDEANLTQQISMIRKALSEGSDSKDRYIVTIPGRGYRFDGPVEEVDRSVPEPKEPKLVVVPITTPVQATAPAANWLKRILVAAAVVLAIGGAVYRWRLPGGQALRGPRSLAILPFRSLRQDANSSFLGFSLADAVITKLGYVNSLTVRPSYSVEKYRDQAIDIKQVAGDLHVDTILTGSFLREGDDLRITSQLIEVKTDRILWRKTFDLKYEKLLTVQDDVARQIIEGLELSLSPMEGEQLKPGKPVDPLAYEYYLRGVDLYARSDFPMAIKMLEKSAEIDPNYASTWAHLGRSYTADASFQFGGREQYQKAQTVYERALSLDPKQIDAQIYMANFFTDTGRVEQAVPLLKKALRTNPNHAEAHWELGYAYRFGGMLKESVAECERARQLDPSVKINSSALNAYLYIGRYEKFLDSLPKNSDSAFLVFYRGFGEYYCKKWSEAAKDFDLAFEMDPQLLQAEVGKAFGDAIAHQNAKGLDTLREAESKIQKRGVGDPEAIYKIAQAYAVLGDKVSALRMLQHSIETGFFSYPYFAADPLLDSLRGDGEFTRLMTVARQRHEAFRGMSS